SSSTFSRIPEKFRAETAGPRCLAPSARAATTGFSVFTRTRLATNRRASSSEYSLRSSPAEETSRLYRCGISSESSRILETSRDTVSQSSIDAPSPLSRSNTTRRTEKRPAPAVSTASSRQPFSAAAPRICSVVIWLNFIEQKSGPLPAPQTPNQQSFIKMDTPVQLACDAFGVDPDRNGARNEIHC